jgi:hypothetical protein
MPLYKTIRAVLLGDLDTLMRAVPETAEDTTEVMEAGNELRNFIMQHTNDEKRWQPNAQFYE